VSSRIPLVANYNRSGPISIIRIRKWCDINRPGRRIKIFKADAINNAGSRTKDIFFACFNDVE